MPLAAPAVVVAAGALRTGAKASTEAMSCSRVRRFGPLDPSSNATAKPGRRIISSSPLRRRTTTGPPESSVTDPPDPASTTAVAAGMRTSVPFGSSSRTSIPSDAATRSRPPSAAADRTRRPSGPRAEDRRVKPAPGLSTMEVPSENASSVHAARPPWMRTPGTTKAGPAPPAAPSRATPVSTTPVKPPPPCARATSDENRTSTTALANRVALMPVPGATPAP